MLTLACIFGAIRAQELGLSREGWAAAAVFAFGADLLLFTGTAAYIIDTMTNCMAGSGTVSGDV